jgi:hypothetical protein
VRVELEPAPRRAAGHALDVLREHGVEELGAVLAGEAQHAALRHVQQADPAPAQA